MLQCLALILNFRVWNIQSTNKKSSSICDLIISKCLDILTITKTWISGNAYDNNTIAEVSNTLNDFQFHYLSRLNCTGGGDGVFLHKGFTIHRRDCIPFTSMEYLDLDISHGTSLIRLVTIYRLPRSKKNLTTVATFFQQFSTLIELLILAPSYLLLNGDFNFHMDVKTDASANTFKDLLESVGLKQHVTGPTHCCGYMLNLIIDRLEDSVLSSFQSLSDLPSDHHMVLCSVAFAKPAASNSKFRQSCPIDMDLDAFKTDLNKSSLLFLTPPISITLLIFTTQNFGSCLISMLQRSLFLLHSIHMHHGLMLHSMIQSVKNATARALIQLQDWRYTGRSTEINV